MVAWGVASTPLRELPGASLQRHPPDRVERNREPPLDQRHGSRRRVGQANPAPAPNWSSPIPARSLTTSQPLNSLEPPSCRWKPAAPTWTGGPKRAAIYGSVLDAMLTPHWLT